MDFHYQYYGDAISPNQCMHVTHEVTGNMQTLILGRLYMCDSGIVIRTIVNNIPF